MNSKKKSMLLIGAVVLLLIAALAVLLLTDPNDGDSASSTASQTEKQKLIDQQADSLVSAKITFDGAGFTIAKSGDQWQVPELDGYKQDSETCAATVSALSQLEAQEKVSDSIEDKARYGLDAPSFSAELSFGGATYTVQIGDSTVDQTAYYATISGDDALYLLAKETAGSLMHSKLYYLDKTILPAANEDDATKTADVQTVTVTRKDLEQPIILSKSAKAGSGEDASTTASDLELTYPVKAQLQNGKAQSLVYSLFGLVATEVAAMNADQVYADYGMTDPTAVIQIIHDGKTSEITVGKQADEKDQTYYVMANDNNLIYTVDGASIALITETVQDMMADWVIMPSIDTISEVALTVGGNDYLFSLSGDSSSLSVKYNGAELDAANFKRFYQLLLDTPADDLNTDQPVSEPQAVLTYRYRDGSAEDTIRMYQKDSRQIIVGLNGDYNFIGRAAYLEKLSAELINLLNGKSVDTNW